jgi:hypothetical protein
MHVVLIEETTRAVTVVFVIKRVSEGVGISQYRFRPLAGWDVGIDSVLSEGHAVFGCSVAVRVELTTAGGERSFEKGLGDDVAEGVGLALCLVHRAFAVASMWTCDSPIPDPELMTQEFVQSYTHREGD